MKKDIHPIYHTEARVQCACGNEMTIGSTKESTEVETCSQCHPFYTGAERGTARGGRVEKFESRMAKKEALASTRTAKKERKKNTPSAKKAA